MNADEIEGIVKLSETYQDYLVDACERCFYCNEPFKECDTLVPGIGVIVGETDVVLYKDKYWHHGCVIDWQKEKKPQGASS